MMVYNSPALDTMTLARGGGDTAANNMCILCLRALDVGAVERQSWFPFEYIFPTVFLFLLSRCVYKTSDEGEASAPWYRGLPWNLSASIYHNFAKLIPAEDVGEREKERDQKKNLCGTDKFPHTLYTSECYIRTLLREAIWNIDKKKIIKFILSCCTMNIFVSSSTLLVLANFLSAHQVARELLTHSESSSSCRADALWKTPSCLSTISHECRQERV